MSDAAVTSERAVAPRRVRPFFWSVRREIWENGAIWIAPLAISAVLMLTFVHSSFSLPKQVASIGRVIGMQKPTDRMEQMGWVASKVVAAQASKDLNMDYLGAMAAPLLVSFIVAIFYSLGALHGERRDRSVLFWKSMPVSNAKTVLAKATIPLVVQPVVTLLIIAAMQVVMLAWSMVVLLANGSDVALFWSTLKLPFYWPMMLAGLFFNTLWLVPFYGWLLVVSAWARRMTFVWALAPWFALMVIEAMTFHSKHVWEFVEMRVLGGLQFTFVVSPQGKAIPVTSLSQIDTARFFTSPELWLGLVVGAGFLAAAVWLRRTRDPI